MITTKQKWILGGLFAMSAGVWAPQLLEATSSDSQAQVPLDGPTEAEMLAIEAEMDGMVFQSDGSEPPRSARSEENRQPGEVDGPDELVGSILGALGTSDVFSGQARHRTLHDIAQDWARESGEGREDDRAPLAAFLEDNPLTATMTSESDRVAMLGSYLVREGDEIPGTGARVMEIDRDGLVLENGGLTLELDLPPLRASQRFARERDALRRRVSAQDEETIPTPEEGDL